LEAMKNTAAISLMSAVNAALSESMDQPGFKVSDWHMISLELIPPVLPNHCRQSNLRARLNSSHATLLSDLKVLGPACLPKNPDGSDGADDNGRLL